MADASPPADRPEMAAPTAAPQLGWKTPDGWEEVPAGEFRVASFKVTGPEGKQAEVTVIPLPGDAGGDFSNVNRWRSQVGQPPVSEEEMKRLGQSVKLAGQSASLYDQHGQNSAGEPTRILAVIQHRDGTAWFFKMTGDSQLVAQQKAAFVQFLQSFQFATGTAMTARSSAPSASAGRPEWNAPVAWKEVPAGQMLVAKFTLAGPGNAQAAVSVSSLAGNGGGLAANVNRWRKQLGLSELAPEQLAQAVKEVATTSGRTTLVEMKGQDARNGQPAALVGAIVLQPEQTWFYKLMGDATVVAAQKDAFTKFVREVKY